MSESEVRHDRRDTKIEFLTESGYWDQSPGIRTWLAALFVILLFALVHFRDVRLENFELDTDAKSYAVAQVDFDFHDSEATLISQQEALRDLGWLYVIDSKYIDQMRRDFKHHVRDHHAWREGVEHTSFEDIYGAISLLFESCHRALFTDSRTFLKLQKFGLDVDHIYVLDGANDQESVRIPAHIWQALATEAFENKTFPEEAMRFAVEQLEDESWHFEVDVTSQRHVREQIFSQVPQKFIKIKAGTRIIDQGERVRERHLGMLKAMKEALKERRQLSHPVAILSSLCIAILIVFLSGTLLRAHYPDIFNSNRRLLLLFTIQALAFGFAKVVERAVLDSTSSGLDMIDSAVFTPFIALSTLSLFPLAVVVILSFLSAMVLSAALPVTGPAFLLINLIALMVTLSTRMDMQYRRAIFIMCLKVLAASIITFLCLHIYTGNLWKSFVIADISFLTGIMVVTAVLVMILQPILENVFKIMTEMTLMDYLDPSRELLRRLSIEAPGTYQHSLLVAHLSEVAASSIGARSLFCRVSSFYHDIGKLAFPHYFVENQQGVNVHQLLTPHESAQVIIAHVSEGVLLARKHNLPEPFIDIIKEHHGTSLVYYFWRKAKDLAKPGQEVQERDFRYCGPKPRSKEAAIIMLADCLEAASRSVEELNEDSVTQLMESLAKHELSDGQLDLSPLSLQELCIVKRVLVKTLVAASHSRVKYPKRDSDDS